MQNLLLSLRIGNQYDAELECLVKPAKLGLLEVVRRVLRDGEDLCA